jgi:hypothetical protein
MMRTRMLLGALGTGFAIVVLTGCQAVSQSPGAGALPPSDARPAKNRDLLYVSSLTGAVSFYSYPQGKLAGTLTAPDGEGGLCSDRQGNVYVPSPEYARVTIYAHGATTPSATLTDDSGPLECAVDPKTGDLATTSEAGILDVYPRGSGTPVSYSIVGVATLFFCTYDDKGDVFADGENDAGYFELVELEHGSPTLKIISVDATVADETGIQWNGKELVLQTAQVDGTATFAFVKVSGSTGKVVGTTGLTAPPNSYGPTQFWLQGPTLVQPDGGNADIGFWNYRAGGSPTKTLQSLGSEQIGVTVSR